MKKVSPLFSVARQKTPDLATQPALFMAGYSHLDTQWRWSYPQVIREYLPNTFNPKTTIKKKG